MGGALHHRPSTDRRRTVCETHRRTDSSRTHGTQHAYEDSTPSTGLRVRLPPLSHFLFLFFFHISCLAFLSFSLTFFSQALRGLPVHCSHILDAPPALIIPGGFFIRSLYKTGLMPKTCVTLPHEPFIHHYMHRYDLSFGQAGLPGSCAYPYVPVRSARW